ncbi:MAG: type I methionyl aminopeptidase [Bacteroidales bacterium]|nr:type I methionyl aminopeptidase [Bacteroidales bacterium]
MVHLIKYKNSDEIELLRQNGQLVGRTLAEVGRNIKPGVKTITIDKIAEEFIRDNGAVPGFKGYGGFPNTLCVSVNDEVVHGIPGNRELKEGDIVSIDCGTILHGYYGDSAYTFAVGNVSEEKRLLMQRTKESLFKGIEMAVAGKRVGDIGYAIQHYVEGFNYSVVRELVGHGIGRNMHESPEIPNYGRRGSGTKLKKGIVICIEPMINLGKRNVYQCDDGWTIKTTDGMPSAHYELTVAINNGKADLLSTFDFVEELLTLQKK